MSATTMKDDKKDEKIQLELIPTGPLREIAKVLMHGVDKYELNDWRKGLEWTRYYGSIQRHMMAWMDGEELDPDSGLPHLAHVATCAMFLLEYQRTNAGEDDRWKPHELLPYEQAHADKVAEVVAAILEIVRSVPGPAVPNPVGASDADNDAD